MTLLIFRALEGMIFASGVFLSSASCQLTSSILKYVSPSRVSHILTFLESRYNTENIPHWKLNLDIITATKFCTNMLLLVLCSCGNWRFWDEVKSFWKMQNNKLPVTASKSVFCLLSISVKPGQISFSISEFLKTLTSGAKKG